jgi:hypothetical protein
MHVYMANNKQQILETITSVCKLITLSFKPVGTKISIRDHKIYLYDPEGSYFQGIGRRWNGDSREDIYVLNQVIINFIELFIIPHQMKDDDMYKGFIDMAKYLCVGFLKLQKTYQNGNVVCTLQYYINVLVSIINKTYVPGMLYRENGNKKNDDEINNYSTFLDSKKMTQIMTDEELIQIFNIFRECFEESNDKNYDRYDFNSTKNFYLPTPKDKNNAFVHSKLCSMEIILDEMDKKFIQILEKSVSGSK